MKDAVGRVDSLLVLGGASEIGLATARRLVSHGTRRVVLAARQPSRLEQQAQGLRSLGAERVELTDFDAGAPPAELDGPLERAFGLGFDIDLALVAFGVLGRDDDGDRSGDAAAAARVLHTNFVAASVTLLALSARMRAQGHGTIAVLSSVAAERARRSNFVYGSSKAGLDAFAQGLSDLLAGSGVTLTVVRPGFVHTQMTAGLKPAPLSVGPDEVAEAIEEGVRRGAHTVWAPPALRWLMLVLRLLPRPLFRKVTARE